MGIGAPQRRGALSDSPGTEAPSKRALEAGIDRENAE